MKTKIARLAVYLLAAVLCYFIAITVSSQTALMTAIAVGLFAEICFWREVFLRWTRVPAPSEPSDR